MTDWRMFGLLGHFPNLVLLQKSENNHNNHNNNNQTRGTRLFFFSINVNLEFGRTRGASSKRNSPVEVIERSTSTTTAADHSPILLLFGKAHRHHAQSTFGPSAEFRMTSRTLKMMMIEGEGEGEVTARPGL